MTSPTLLLAALALAVLDASPSTERLVRAEAFDRTTGALLFVEEHAEQWRDGRWSASRVTFRSPDGEAIARKWIFASTRPWTPAWESVDLRSGLREAVRPDAGSLVLAWQRDARAPVRSLSVDWPDRAVADSGLFAFIEGHWARLLAGERLELEQIVPARLALYDFRLRRVAAANATEGEPTVTFELTAASPFIRLVLDPILVTYATRDRRLLEMTGRTALADDAGRPIIGRMLFRGGAPGVRPEFP